MTTAKMGDIREVRELDNDQYTLVQTDIEIMDILDNVGKRGASYGCLFVKIDQSSADYVEVWGISQSVPNLNAGAECLFAGWNECGVCGGDGIELNHNDGTAGQHSCHECGGTGKDGGRQSLYQR